MASPFLAQQSETAMSFVCSTWRHICSVLNRVYLEHQFLKVKYPVAKQEKELLGEATPEEDEWPYTH